VPGIKRWPVPRTSFNSLIIFRNLGKSGRAIVVCTIGGIEFRRCTEQYSRHMQQNVVERGLPSYFNCVSLYIYIILDHVSNNKDNKPTTMSPICLMTASSGRSDDSSLTTLLAWLYIFCWSEYMLSTGLIGGVENGGRRTSFCRLVLELSHTFEAELERN
jgi:hypothetical protein